MTVIYTDVPRKWSYYGESGSFWAPPNFPAYSAWTADIPTYWARWAEVNGSGSEPVVDPDFSLTQGQQSILYTYSIPGSVPVQFVEVVGGNHDWFGHAKSEPMSDNPASLQIDATKLISDFFGIPLSEDTPVSVPTRNLAPA